MNAEELLEYLVSHKGSDLHITVGAPPIVRINGLLTRIEEYPNLMPDDTEKLMNELLNDEQKKVFEDRGEVDFSVSKSGCGRYRVNIYRQRGSCSIAIRSIPLQVPSIEDLGLPDVLKDLSSNKRGLVLVTGPTGSGKSTTLAAMISHINKTRNAHILTLEDPIEYLHRHNKSLVNQREIGNDSKSYGNALRAALRQDPDVILIGEMRDLETISIALTAAETGHLVLSTLHTVGAVSTVDRIIDVFPSHQQQQIRIQLANVLQGVLSQQLLKRVDGSGRVAAVEIMLCNAAIKNHIREGKTHQVLSSIQTGGKLGMITMDNSISQLYRNKMISYDEAINYAIDRDFIARLI